MTSPHTPLPGMDWGGYIEHFVAAHGGWVQLSYALVHHARGIPDLSDDPQTIEKGLRRLAKRGHKDGGQYGRWMLRFFGLPDAVAAWLKWMGQYHSRFSDLPLTLRRDQLALWDRTPMRDAPQSIWLDLGHASVSMRSGDREDVASRLTSITSRLRTQPDDATLEAWLFAARISSDAGDHDACDAMLADASSLLEASETLSDTDRALYHSRVLDQRAYRVLHPASGAPDVARARGLYASIDPGPDVLPFAAYQRDLGLAYCAWKQGDADAARAFAEDSVAHAGDGGFVRLRVVACNLRSRIGDEPGDGPWRERARRLARALEDEELLRRVDKA